MGECKSCGAPAHVVQRGLCDPCIRRGLERMDADLTWMALGVADLAAAFRRAAEAMEQFAREEEAGDEWKRGRRPDGSTTDA